MSERRYGLDDVVNAIDALGNHYRRKIRTGIKRGEFILKRDKDGIPLALQTAAPTHIWLTNRKTGKRMKRPIGIDDDGNVFRLCFLLTEEAFAEAQGLSHE